MSVRFCYACGRSFTSDDFAHRTCTNCKTLFPRADVAGVPVPEPTPEPTLAELASTTLADPLPKPKPRPARRYGP